MTTSTDPAARPTFAELFTPKLVTVFREGYGLAHLRADALAGLTVAIVALPLSMAIAIASGASPAQGLYTAIFGGFLISALGGSRFQIGGPAGAFIVLVAASIGAVLDRIASAHRALIIDFSGVPFVDSTAANTLEGIVRKAGRSHMQVVFTGTSQEMRTELGLHGLAPPRVRSESSIESALGMRGLTSARRAHEAASPSATS